VTIRDFSFGPSAVTVHVGDTGPTDHTATGAGFDTGILRKGQSGSHTFTSAGTFSYHCSLHPFMKGTVTVVAASGGGGGGGTTSMPASAPSSGGTAKGSSAAAPATAATPTPTGSPAATLPHTGIDALALAALGAVALLLGVVLRLVTRQR
jgi:LPXTG-motif cell wall-anchored protein